SVISNAKRIYDESLMVKKVKTYLNNAEIIDDENRLLEFANQFEPVALGGIPASPSISLSKVSAVVDESEFCIGNTPKISRVKEEHHDVDNEKHPAITKIEGKHNNRNRHLILRPHSSPSTLRAFKTALYHVSTLKRRPSPSTSSLSSNSSCDRRAAPIQLTKFGM
ncbi:unnamed protein product, partial [Rotaria socialis]